MNVILKNIVYHAPWLLSDRKFLELSWELRMGRPLDLDNPETFNEKIQWLKLNDRRPEYTMMADKVEVKEWAASVIGEEHVIPTIGVYGSASEIPWDKLPESFVLKCNHDSGGLVVCRDKSQLDRSSAARRLDSCMKRNFFFFSREWCYKDIKRRILCEKYMHEEGSDASLIDYKFFCFNGEPRFMYVSGGLENHSTAKISFADTDGNPLPFRRLDFAAFEDEIPMPSDLDGMKAIASQLAEAVGNRFVRVDLYEIGGRVYFSELTFYPCGGYLPFSPAEWDARIGEMLQL